jgi:hypothetical protein
MAVSSGAKKGSSSKSSGGFTKGPSKKSTKVGGGGRFENCVASGKSKALCSSIGRAKFGKAKFQKMASKGKKKG